MYALLRFLSVLIALWAWWVYSPRMVDVVGGRMSGLHISVIALWRVVSRALRMLRRSGGVHHAVRFCRCGVGREGPREVCPAGAWVGVRADVLVLLCGDTRVNGLAYRKICSCPPRWVWWCGVMSVQVVLVTEVSSKQYQESPRLARLVQCPASYVLPWWRTIPTRS